MLKTTKRFLFCSGLLQISKVEGVWTNCTSADDCAASFVGPLTAAVAMGFLFPTNLRPYTEYSVAVRGCNNDGCGNSGVVLIRTALSAPSEPLGLNVSTSEDGSGEVTWDLPLEPAGPLDGFLVSWQCPPGEMFSSTVNGTSLGISSAYFFLVNLSFAFVRE